MKQLFTFFTNSDRVNAFSELTVGQMHIAAVGMVIVVAIMVVALLRAKDNTQVEY